MPITPSGPSFILCEVPVPSHSGPRTFFFLADVEPKEAMGFGIEHGIALTKDSTLEVFGHMLAFWTVIKGDPDFSNLRVRAQDLFDVSIAIYALVRLDRGERRDGLALRAVTHSWVEARVASRANVIGTIHGRYTGRTRKLTLGKQEACDFELAAQAAWRFIDRATVRLAFKDFGLSLGERGDDAFLFSYRAVENVRRTLAPDTVDKKGHFSPDWPGMHAVLNTDEDMLKPLTSAATAVRHGRVDATALKWARGKRNRAKTLGLCHDLLKRFLAHEGVTW